MTAEASGESAKSTSIVRALEASMESKIPTFFGVGILLVTISVYAIKKLMQTEGNDVNGHK